MAAPHLSPQCSAPFRSILMASVGFHVDAGLRHLLWLQVADVAPNTHTWSLSLEESGIFVGVARHGRSQFP